MKVSIIGSGNVASALARALSESPDLNFVQVCARNEKQGRALAEELGVKYAELTERLEPADVYIISVSDGAIYDLASTIDFPKDSVVAHTAGGLGLDALGDKITHRAVLYPLQTFSKGRNVDMSSVPIFVEYSDDYTGERIRLLAGAISNRVAHADGEQRIRLHAAAVFACNFVNYMYCAANDILGGGDAGFDVLKPLILETVNKALSLSSPSKGQTGPAVRGDEATMERHLELLRKDISGSGQNNKKGEYYEKTYKLLSEAIWETLRKT